MAVLRLREILSTEKEMGSDYTQKRLKALQNLQLEAIALVIRKCDIFQISGMRK